MIDFSLFSSHSTIDLISNKSSPKHCYSNANLDETFNYEIWTKNNHARMNKRLKRNEHVDYIGASIDKAREGWRKRDACWISREGTRGKKGEEQRRQRKHIYGAFPKKNRCRSSSFYVMWRTDSFIHSFIYSVLWTRQQRCHYRHDQLEQQVGDRKMNR